MEVVMTRTTLCTALCSLFFTTCLNTNAAADGLTDDVQIVIAADQSLSMYRSPAHINMQTQALHEFFTHLPVTCAKIQVTYIGWGETATPNLQASLTAKGSAAHFADDIYWYSFFQLGGTDHLLGLLHAVAVLDDTATKQIIIFTTDEFSLDTSGYGIKAVIPARVGFYGIAIGNDSVFKYVQS